jgi:hypothetical protein
LFLADADGVRRIATTGAEPSLDDDQRGTLRRYLTTVVDTRSSLLLPDLRVHPCFARDAPDGSAMRFAVAVPVTLEHTANVVGVLVLADTEPRRFEAEDLAIVEDLGRRSSLLLGDAANGEMPLVRAEGLTRRSFERLLALELRLARRLSKPVYISVVNVEPVTELATAARELVARAAWPRSAVGRLGPSRLGIFVRGSGEPTTMPDVSTALTDELARFAHVTVTLAPGPHRTPAADALLDHAEHLLAVTHRPQRRSGG